MSVLLALKASQDQPVPRVQTELMVLPARLVLKESLGLQVLLGQMV